MDILHYEFSSISSTMHLNFQLIPYTILQTSARDNRDLYNALIVTTAVTILVLIMHMGVCYLTLP